MHRMAARLHSRGRQLHTSGSHAHVSVQWVCSFGLHSSCAGAFEFVEQLVQTCRSFLRHLCGLQLLCQVLDKHKGPSLHISEVSCDRTACNSNLSRQSARRPAPVVRLLQHDSVNAACACSLRRLQMLNWLSGFHRPSTSQLTALPDRLARWC